MYLDPGSGSVILQAILASLLGIGVVVRIFWKKITSFTSKSQIKSPETEEKDITDQP
ncbi:MAG: hypothetical protein ABFD51_05915 [Anaerolineaceae bacterium]